MEKRLQVILALSAVLNAVPLCRMGSKDRSRGTGLREDNHGERGLTRLLFVGTARDCGHGATQTGGKTSALIIKNQQSSQRPRAVLRILPDVGRGWKYTYTMCVYTNTHAQCLCKHHMAKPCSIKLANPERGFATLVSHTQKGPGHPSKIHLTEGKVNSHSCILLPPLSKGYCPIFPSNGARCPSL